VTVEGYFAGKWSLERMTKSGVFGNEWRWWVVREKEQSPE